MMSHNFDSKHKHFPFWSNSFYKRELKAARMLRNIIYVHSVLPIKSTYKQRETLTEFFI